MQPKPKEPKPEEPKPEKPKPVKPEPEKSKPKKQDDRENGNPVGMFLATLFLLIGIGGPLGYLLYRVILGDDDDDDYPDDGIYYDDIDISISDLDE